MANAKPLHKNLEIIGAVILLTLMAGVLLFTYHENNLADQNAAQQQISKTAPYENTSDAQVTDAKEKNAVNFDRLKRAVQKLQNKSTNTVDTTQLDAAINQIITTNPDITFGVSIEYLKNGQVLNYGSQDSMTAASVTKVLTAIDYYKQVELGNKSLSDKMTNGVTAQDNIEQMIVVSDNDAWQVLNESLTYQQMGQYAKSIGLNSYDYNENTISASDMTQLLSDMYQRKLINDTNAQQLLSYMERANYRNLIIPAVPDADTTYHKAGEYDSFLHDAAIITNDNDTIVLTIFTNSLNGYSQSRIAGLMQQITTPTLTTFNLD